MELSQAAAAKALLAALLPYMLFGLRSITNRSLAIISGPLPPCATLSITGTAAAEKMTRSTPLINIEFHKSLALAAS